MLQFLERRNQIRHRPAPAIQAPNQNHIDFTAACGSDQGCASFPLRRAGADLFYLRDDGPSALGCVFAHGADLQGKCLLIVGGNASVKAHPKGVAKNLVGERLQKSLFFGHFRSVALIKAGLAAI